MRNLILVSLVTAFFLSGCAVTKVEITGRQLKEPLCQEGGPPVSTLVYWGAKWRADQKEPLQREAAALLGIKDFLNRAGCLSVVAINRLTTEQAQGSHEEILRLASTYNPKPEMVLLVVVRELGPKLLVGIPVIVEGGTEVLIDVHVFNPPAAEALAATQTLWQNGGAFVIKGVKTLDQDMGAALTSTLMFSQSAQ